MRFTNLENEMKQAGKKTDSRAMITEEEYTPIKLREHCIKTMQFSNRDSNTYKEHELILETLNENISLKEKVEQLETEKQNLIEKLESRKEALEGLKSQKKLTEYGKGALELLEEILSYMKGEEK